MIKWLIFLQTSLFPLMILARLDCSNKEYERCIRIADPLIKEPHLIFPDNLNDIELVCKTWNRFVDCLKRYTDYCFTDQQRRQFNKAVEVPIESVHQMCMQPGYQQEYLHHAPCMKSTITEKLHCRSHYNLLVDQVSQGDIISKSTLCCSHDRFKQCVEKETRRLCDRGIPDGPASRFSNQIIDKALRFLQDQCQNYIPNSGDCTSLLTTDSVTYSDPSTIPSSSPSDAYPWSSGGGSTRGQQDRQQKEILSSRVTPAKSVSTSWLPSYNLPLDTTQSEAAEPSSSTQQQQHTVLNGRTRPASYGRSNSWLSSDTTPSSTSQTVQMFPELVSSTTVPSARPNWATVQSTWPRVEEPTVSSTWYPAAGSQLINEVDEPNQQGLTKFRNSGNSFQQGIFLGLVLLLAGLNRLVN